MERLETADENSCFSLLHVLDSSGKLSSLRSKYTVHSSIKKCVTVFSFSASLLQVVEIDGSIGDGGGQILRTALALAAVRGKSIRISKIRAGRKEAGLRPQHLQSLLAVTKISGGTVSGASVGSTEITFSPGKLPNHFAGIIDTGTAGSISLIAQTVIPLSIFGGVDLDLEIRGGTEVPNSPTVDYLSRIVLPVYRKLGAKIEFDVKRRGYYPRGGGVVKLDCSRESEPHSIELISGNVEPANIYSVSRSLPPHVAQRQADSAREVLEHNGFKTGSIKLDSSGESLSPGSSILIFTADHFTFLGASSLGERGKKAEVVGEEATRNFLREALNKPAVDSHLADMLITLLCCVPGKSTFTTSFLTDHFSTNCAVAKKLAGCEITTEKSGEAWRVQVAGLPEKPN
jgi:RNA 3'-phosphate cyclase